MSKKLNIIILIITTLHSCSYNFELEEGDLLFQDLDSSPLCEAIEKVTPGYRDGNFSHIGLVIKHKNEIFILEAIPPKVKLTNLNDFLNRSLDNNNNPKVIVGRLKEKYKNSIPHAVKYAKSKLDDKYDDYFLLNNDSYYCSELIYEAFNSYNIFELKPMNFLNLNNNDTNIIWKNYYTDLGINIPQNELGLNPGIMSLSNKIKIVHIFGKPEGIILN